MDLVVYTSDTMRNVSGVTPQTTCAQLVYALAHATQQKGRFVLVATFSNSKKEHRMVAEEKPYSLVDECMNQGIEVHFHLRRLDPASDIVLKTPNVVDDEKRENSDQNSHHYSLDYQQNECNYRGGSLPNFSPVLRDSATNSPVASSSSLNEKDEKATKGIPEKNNNVGDDSDIIVDHTELDSDADSSHYFHYSRQHHPYRYSYHHHDHHSKFLDENDENKGGGNFLQFERKIEDDNAHAPSHLNHHQANNNPLPIESNENFSKSNAESMADAHTIAKKELRRPPPPTYAVVIEQRCNSLTRGGVITRHRSSLQPRQQSSPTTVNNCKHNSVGGASGDFALSTILNMTVSDLHTREFTSYELEILVESQNRIIAAQKSELLGLELTLSNDAERELVQLKKQHNNLQTVLNSLRNANWHTRVEAEQKEAERLHTAIDAMKTAIENKRRELQQVIELQSMLEHQIASMESECAIDENFKMIFATKSGSENIDPGAAYS